MKFRKVTAAVMVTAIMASVTSALTASADAYYAKVNKGDVNGDKCVDIEDYIAVVNHVNGVKAINSKRLSIADVNWDGVVDIFDAQLISYDINGIKPIRSANVLNRYYVSTDDVEAILDHINGVKALSSSRLKRADVNWDGVVDVEDVAIIQNYISNRAVVR